jgi:hypothetical protein
LVVPARTRRAALAFGLLERYEWISANRQTLAQRTPAAPMIPPSLGLRLPAAVTRGATKAHDEVWQRTQVPPRPGSHQRLLARCSLRTPPRGGYKCRRAFCDDKHDLFDVDPTNNIQARSPASLCRIPDSMPHSTRGGRLFASSPPCGRRVGAAMAVPGGPYRGRLLLRLALLGLASAGSDRPMYTIYDEDLGDLVRSTGRNSRLTGVSWIEAVFRAHVSHERKVLAASNQPDDG